MDELKKIIVIGASAGGFDAIAQLISILPAGEGLAVFIVLHLSKNSNGNVIIQHIQQRTSLTCRVPEDREPILSGHLYLAPPDHHMMVKQGSIRIHTGPKENRWRPSIDVLFRSAAVAYDSHVIGIVLTGLMDDGTSGMSAIKRSGGICIVQEPSEALYPDMPTSVLNIVEVDYQVPIADMGYIIADNLSKPAKEFLPIPREVKIEAEITESMVSSIDRLKEIGKKSDFSCPDCGGILWKLNHDGTHRYRCYTGHAYTESVLNETQSKGLEESLWVSIRMLEERRNLLKLMSQHENEAGHAAQSIETQKRAEEAVVHIERLKLMLYSMDKNGGATVETKS
ncbi:MAG: two-component system, chemotaxis family, protein-glutamate methylesterase/glutaminase [Mucilaginibacter sp.]|nr:two-component system, chemotaxis family, protein-glutamate methylesterase/glutaminase [Mucilaginibacter sp.]